MKKLKAFTLVELLIAMVISGIVITFCYAGYSILHEQFQHFKEVKRSFVHLRQFQSTVSNDFYTYEYARFNEQSIMLEDEKRERTVYKIEGDYVLRSLNEQVDTFFIEVGELHPTFLFEESGDLIRSFTFDVYINDEELPFSFSKEYSAATLINLSE